MSKRLEILKNSLSNKQFKLTEKLDEHFKSVASANGQPLNDKRGGHKTLSKWDQQNDQIRKLIFEIEKTERAIEGEQYKIHNCESIALPVIIQEFIHCGILTQWRKYPNRFFVHGVNKGRIVLNEQTGTISHSHLQEVTSPSEYAVFRDVYNHLRHCLND